MLPSAAAGCRCGSMSSPLLFVRCRNVARASCPCVPGPPRPCLRCCFRRCCCRTAAPCLVFFFAPEGARILPGARPSAAAAPGTVAPIAAGEQVAPCGWILSTAEGQDAPAHLRLAFIHWAQKQTTPRPASPENRGARCQGLSPDRPPARAEVLFGSQSDYGTCPFFFKPNPALDASEAAGQEPACGERCVAIDLSNARRIPRCPYYDTARLPPSLSL